MVKRSRRSRKSVSLVCAAMADPANPILLYDGVCGLCNRLVQFVLKRDSSGHFRFASLQSDFASRILRQHGLDPDDLDTVYLVEAPGQRPAPPVLMPSSPCCENWEDSGPR